MRITTVQHPGRLAAMAQRLAGFLAFCGLALGAFIAGRDECTERTHAQQARGRANLSTLAPIMGANNGMPPALPSRMGAAACLHQAGPSPQAGRSAKLKPTP